MILSLARTKRSIQALPEMLKKYFFLFVALEVVNSIFNQTMIFFQEERMTSRQDNYIPYMMAVAFVGFFVQAGTKVIWTFVICHHFSHTTKSLGGFIKDHLEKGVIESLRAFLKSIKWGFLFIIPGLIKAIRFQFVNFIICTSKQYEQGELDALKSSENMSKGHIWGLLLLFLFFTILSMAVTSNYLLIERPVSVLSVELISLVLMTFEMIYIYFVFDDILTKGQA